MTEDDRRRLVDGNLPLAKWWARRYASPSLGNLDDLRQEAAMALCKAAGRYDPARGPFAVLASWYIRSALRRQALRERRHRQRYISLERIGYEDSDTLERIADPRGEDPEETALAQLGPVVIEQLLAHLRPREAAVMRLWLKGWTFQRIAARLRFTRQRAQALHARACKRLRRHPAIRELRRLGRGASGRRR